METHQLRTITMIVLKYNIICNKSIANRDLLVTLQADKLCTLSHIEKSKNSMNSPETEILEYRWNDGMTSPNMPNGTICRRYARTFQRQITWATSTMFSISEAIITDWSW